MLFHFLPFVQVEICTLKTNLIRLYFMYNGYSVDLSEIRPFKYLGACRFCMIQIAEI